MSETTGTAGTLETPADAGRGGAGVVSMWLDAIDLAGKEERRWREQAEMVERIYRDDVRGDVSVERETARRFNILYSNTETLAPAIYNTPPIPDVRRRFRDKDPIGKEAARVLERDLSYCLDEYDFSTCMDAAVKDMLLPGRGLMRVRYVPQFAEDSTIAAEYVECEYVDWRRFRRGPAATWDRVPWIAFELFLTRAEFERLDPKIGARIDLDCSATEGRKAGDAKPEPEMLKRGRVWEIWDREKRKVYFIAPAWKDEPVQVVDDPLGLKWFYPVPRPLYAMEVPGNLVPVPLYRSYQALAEELEITSRRIASLTAALRWRGAYLDPAIGDFLAQFEELEDGGMLPVQNPAAAQAGGLDKAFWFQPIDVLVQVLQRLYEARLQTKQAIYEITGISDIVRGASMASETATAQQIKAQWGSLRVQKMQREVQRFARDMLRMMAEIMAEKFQPATLFAMAGVNLPTSAQLQIAQMMGQQVPPDTVTQEQVTEFLRDELMRTYRVDIETDSTIRADLTGEQQNISQFVTGFGGFIQSIGPAVQAGFVQMPEAAALLKSFSRAFKLGRDAEDAIEALGETQPPPQQQGEDPAAAAQAQMQAEQMKMQAEMQAAQMKMQADAAANQAKMENAVEIERLKQEGETRRELMRLQAEAERHAMTMEVDRERATMDAQRASSERATPAVGLTLNDAVQDAIAASQGQQAASMAEVAGGLSAAVEAMRGTAVQIGEAARMMAAPKRVRRGADGRVEGVEAAL